jgi:uncharacterized membrane protein YphA (DoxX/SURF4 family)
VPSSFKSDNRRFYSLVRTLIFKHFKDQLMSRVLSSLLILVWIYTGFEKLFKFEQSRKAFLNQTFPTELAEILSYSVPITELLIASLLLFPVTRWWGYLGSTLLLTVFVTYVGLIWVGAFPRVPCNCAGIIESLGWGAHFVLNMFLIGAAVLGLRLEK